MACRHLIFIFGIVVQIFFITSALAQGGAAAAAIRNKLEQLKKLKMESGGTANTPEQPGSGGCRMLQEIIASRGYCNDLNNTLSCPQDQTKLAALLNTMDRYTACEPPPPKETVATSGTTGPGCLMIVTSPKSLMTSKSLPKQGTCGRSCRVAAAAEFCGNGGRVGYDCSETNSGFSNAPATESSVFVCPPSNLVPCWFENKPIVGDFSYTPAGEAACAEKAKKKYMEEGRNRTAEFLKICYNTNCSTKATRRFDNGAITYEGIPSYEIMITVNLAGKNFGPDNKPRVHVFKEACPTERLKPPECQGGSIPDSVGGRAN